MSTETQTQLTTSIYNHDLTKPKIDTDQLLNALQNQLKHSQNNNHHTHQIINILGGIDNILNQYKTSFNNKIHDALIQQRITQIKSINRDATLISYQTSLDKNNLEDFNKPKLTLTFYAKNTYLHSIFGEKVASIILKVIYNRCFVFSNVAISLPMNFVEILWLRNIHLLWNITWGTFLVLSVNRNVFRHHIIKSFQFWIHILYSTLLMVTFAFQKSHNNINEQAFQSKQSQDFTSQNDQPDVIQQMIYYAFFLLAVVDTIVYVSCFDGIAAIYLSRCAKLFVACAYMLAVSWFAVILTFSAYNNQGNIIHLTDGLSIAPNSILANSSRILSMFLWKQVLLAMARKDRCSLIRYTPYFKWIDDALQPALSSSIQSVELETPKSVDLSKSPNSTNTTPKYDASYINEVISILGGIDEVLKDYIRSASLTQDQMDNLYYLITQPNSKTIGKQNMLKHDHGKMEIQQSEKYQYAMPSFTYTFSFKNTMLYRLFGTVKGLRLRNIVYKPYFVIYAALLTLGFIVLDSGFITGVSEAYTRILLCSLSVFPVALAFGTADLSGVKLIAKTFAFWVKVLYTIIAVLCAMYIRNYTKNYSDINIRICWIASDIWYLFYSVFLTVDLAIIDVMDFKYKLKVITTLVVSGGVCVRALITTLTVWELDDANAVIISKQYGVGVSVNSLLASSWRIVALFFIKQGASSIIKKEKANIVNYAPYLKWIVDDNEQITNEQVGNMHAAAVETEHNTNMQQEIDAAQINYGEDNFDELEEVLEYVTNNCTDSDSSDHSEIP